MTPKPLARFWKSLDKIPGAATDQRDWSRQLKGDWQHAQIFLKPTGRLVKEIACPSPGGDGCPRKVVRLDDRRFRAVCGNKPADCDTITLTANDIAVLALDRKKLSATLCTILGAAPAGERAEGAAMLVGSHSVRAGARIPVILVIPGPMPGDTLRLWPAGGGPAAIVTPTATSLPSQTMSAFEEAGHTLLNLSDIVDVDGQHRLCGSLPAETLLAAARQKIKTAARASRHAWILPPDALWEEVTLQFTSDDRLLVRFRGETRTFDAFEFGMTSQKNNSATDAWGFLQVIVRNGGRVSWDDNRKQVDTARVRKAGNSALRKPDPTSLLRKNKQAVSRHLKSTFGLLDDPIKREGRRAYKARFKVMDTNPAHAPARHQA